MEEERTIWGWGLVLSLLFFSVAAFTILLGGADQLRVFVWGENTTGIVTEMRRTVSTKNGGHSYYLSYDYEVGGRKLTGGNAVSEREYELLAKGSPLSVAYLPNKPEVSSYEDILASNCFSLALVLGGSGLAAAISLFFTFRRRKPTAVTG